MNTLQEMIEAAKKEQDAMWAVAKAATIKGLATLHAQQGARQVRTPDGTYLIDIMNA